MLLENGAEVTTDILCEESELLGAVRTDQTLVAEILLTNGNHPSSHEGLRINQFYVDSIHSKNTKHFENQCFFLWEIYIGTGL